MCRLPLSLIEISFQHEVDNIVDCTALKATIDSGIKLNIMDASSKDLILASQEFHGSLFIYIFIV